jgi:DNA-3-methyladenine glycosylase I
MIISSRYNGGHMERCKWTNLESSDVYKEYHDNEWGVASYDDRYLFEMFTLEAFHCGLSWLIILKKRESFKKVFDDFIPDIVAKYDALKIEELMQNKDIVRNRAKILAAINNSKCFLKVQDEFESFCNYIWSFTNGKVLYYPFDGVTTKNDLSDKISKDLKKRGFKFMGSVTTFSYLEAIGIMNNHAQYCYKYHAILKKRCKR